MDPVTARDSEVVEPWGTWHDRARVTLDSDDDEETRTSVGVYGDEDACASKERSRVRRRSRQRRIAWIIVAIFVGCLVLLTAVTYSLPEGTVERTVHKVVGHGDDDDGEHSHWTRLAQHTYPEWYRLSVQPDMQAFYYSAEVHIGCVRKREARNLRHVVLNAEGLQLHEARVWVHGQRDSVVASIHEHYDHGRVSIVAAELKGARTFNVSIRYSARLSDGMTGFYRSSYHEERGGEGSHLHWLALTDFEPMAARRALPCFDEPAFKAVLHLSVLAPAGYHVLSNAALAGTRDSSNGSTWYEFEGTPAMSSYLYSWCVSKLRSVSALTADGAVTVRVWARPGLQDASEYAARTAAVILHSYALQLGAHYPLSKLDLIAVPDFSAGAMENWGCITFRESALLWRSGSSSSADQLRVATVIAHELAHQWFGDAVTPMWWDDLWLNEGAASYMEFLGVGAAEPEWRVGDMFHVLTRARALDVDALASSHALKPHISYISSVAQQFDAISYNKGASVLRMLHAFMGAPALLTAFRHYLAQHAGGSVRSNDLWNALERSSCNDDAEAPVQQQPCRKYKKLMKQWTLLRGFPLLTLTYSAYDSSTSSSSSSSSSFSSSPSSWSTSSSSSSWQPSSSSSSDDDDASGEVVIRQKYFCTSSDCRALDTTWWLPLTLRVGDTQERDAHDASDSIHAELRHGRYRRRVRVRAHSPTSYVLADVGASGYWRVAYDDALRSRLQRALRAGAVPAASVTRIVDDAYALCRSRLLTWPALHALLSAVLQGMAVPGNALHRDYSVWHTVLHGASSMRALLYAAGDDAAVPAVRTALQALLQQPLQAALQLSGTWSPPSAAAGLQSRLLRGLLLDTTLRWDYDTSVTAEGAALFNDYAFGNTTTHATGDDDDGPQLHPDLHAPVFTAAVLARNSDAKRVEAWLLQRYSDEVLSAPRLRALHSLAYSRDDAVLHRTLHMALSDTVRRQDSPGCICRVALSSDMGRVLAWRFFKSKYDVLMARYNGEHSAMNSLVACVTAHMATQQDLADVRAFFAEHRTPASSRAIDNAIHSIQANMDWISYIQ